MLKTKRRKAVFTISHNEGIYLPIWLKYYRQHFDDRDIYVLDHNTTDGSTDQLPVNCEFVNNELFQDNQWLLRVTSDFQKKLLRDYQQVLFPHVDEMIVPNPEKYGDLSEFLALNNKDMIRCAGREVIHMIRDEPDDFDPDKLVTEQRGYWFDNDEVYGKVVLSKVPIDWSIGWHRAKNFHGDVDLDLSLVHLHRMDYKICEDKHVDMTKRKWQKEDVEVKKWGWHSLICDSTFFRWFYCVPVACTLHAPVSLKMFEEHLENKNDDQTYEAAKSFCRQIPESYKGMF